MRYLGEVVLIRIYDPGGRYQARWEPDYIELGYMYSRSVSVIRSKRITAADFQVPPYTSGLHMPPSGVFLLSLTLYRKQGQNVR